MRAAQLLAQPDDLAYDNKRRRPDISLRRPVRYVIEHPDDNAFLTRRARGDHRSGRRAGASARDQLGSD